MLRPGSGGPRGGSSKLLRPAAPVTARPRRTYANEADAAPITTPSPRLRHPPPEPERVGEKRQIKGDEDDGTQV